MKIGIIGGTGGMGKGFALRWCNKHEILIGSRDSSRAANTADEYSKTAKEIFNNENALITEHQEDSVIISKPLSESEMIDLMIYGEDVIDFGVSPKLIAEKK